jgi:hypothetical protein
MTTPTIIEDFHVIEDRILRLLTTLERFQIPTFGLSGMEKTLRHRVVPTVAFAAHARLNALMMEKPSVAIRHLLTASIGVQDQPGLRLTLVERHLECVRHEFRFEPRAHRPAYDRP